ncbi:hypothetical protein PMG11_00457 [Penicillium brasilianum]|uniref:Uncharacterized protein n=1 Tax=Penicillium brasilianum TaxID=104259 RepID=A0A0F7TCL5_PENBI|nr:hypothetical protein PMG11_00457 [Penicillium brasilianum]
MRSHALDHRVIHTDGVVGQLRNGGLMAYQIGQLVDLQYFCRHLADGYTPAGLGQHHRRHGRLAWPIKPVTRRNSGLEI